MNKQRKTYILLAAVIIIWSIVGFQIFGYLNSGEEELTEVNYKKFTPKQGKEKELYTVATHGRDPFLGRYNQPKKKIVRTVKKEKEPIIFPRIQYKGFIKNKNKKLFILTINGAQKILQIGQVFNDVRVVSGNNREVTLKYKGEVKSFSK
ncbi:hypothetical protein ACOSP6_01680 [Tenacibaculum sp. MEBiC06402]|uniref:hypothetical protein n=1 Tax=unclassified Tenacibaculum TaxID=2635139 RepID=UPI003B9A4DBB